MKRNAVRTFAVFLSMALLAACSQVRATLQEGNAFQLPPEGLPAQQLNDVKNGFHFCSLPGNQNGLDVRQTFFNPDKSMDTTNLDQIIVVDAGNCDPGKDILVKTSNLRGIDPLDQGTTNDVIARLCGIGVLGNAKSSDLAKKFGVQDEFARYCAGKEAK